MKVPWLRSVLVGMSLIGCCLGCTAEFSSQDALKSVEKTEEMKSFYDVIGKDKESCFVKKVVRPCDTDWVTCIDDAWVVEISIKDECFSHDGRLSFNVLLDEKSGKIISRFPEVGYFKDPSYCLEDYDCLLVASGKEEDIRCENFIHAQINGVNEVNSKACYCQKGMCTK